jgi:AcrR family transcriptional regulator
VTTVEGVATRIDGGHIDGRTLRRTRNRTAVIDALLEIVREGDLHPGAAEIADRAGVSHRSIFRYFDDLDDLVRTAIDQAFQQAKPLAEIPRIGVGTTSARIGDLVDSRLALFEHVDATMQLARMRAPSIPAIDEGFAKIAEFFRSQTALHFAAELDTLAEHERPLMVDGVLVLTSYDSYAIHLRLLGSDVERIRSCWVTALSAMLS